MPRASRRCTRCLRTKHLGKFRVTTRRAPSGVLAKYRDSWCKACRTEQRKLRRQRLVAAAERARRLGTLVRKLPDFACTLDEVAKELDVSRERARQIEAAALLKLRSRLGFLLQRDVRMASDHDLVEMIFR